MKWALQDPVRFLHERDELERLLRESEWLRGVVWKIDPALTIEVEIDLDVHGINYSALLTYPELFPQTPPFIRPRDSAAHWTGHQYGPGGSLCLEWRADNWDSSVTGADLVRSAYKLLSTENHPVDHAEVLSVHELTLGQKIHGRHRFVCTPGFLKEVSSTPMPGIRRLKTNTIFHKKLLVGFVSRIDQLDSMREVSDLPKGISAIGPLCTWQRDGVLFRHNIFDQLSRIESVQELADAVEAAGFADQVPSLSLRGDRLVLLVGSEPTLLQVFGTSIDESQQLDQYTVLPPETDDSRLPQEHELLRNIKVAIVGLGSLGSKIAISLGRSGIRKFLLVDDDILLPQNICRHELAWEAVGVHKAEAVREALSLIAPTMNIEVRLHRVAGQESAMTAASTLKDLTGCDVLIDGTANPQVFLRLAAVARVARRAMCWGEVFAGGFGGLIARARPDRDPNPAALRAAILRHFETLAPAPNRRADGYNVSDGEPAVAYDSEVTQVAACLTRVAVDLALKRDPSEFPYSAYLIGLRKEWIFSQPFDTYPIQVTGEGWGAHGNEGDVAEEDRTKAAKVLLDMIVEGQHVDADSST